MTAPLRLGMVGGGEGAFIGDAHRKAAALDGRWRLVAGCFSSDPANSARTGVMLGIDPDRCYVDHHAMAAAEAARADGIDAVAICIPNWLHAPVSKAFLDAGIHVICDKPLTNTVADAEALIATASETGRLLIPTYTYSGYTMAREARRMIAEGAIGAVRAVHVIYLQDWLASPIERDGQKQAAWRVDPTLGGQGGVLADIGTHAYHLATFMTGLRAIALCADVVTEIAGRPVPDNANVWLRFEGGARGALAVSQTAIGHANDLSVRIHGEKGSLHWRQEEPELLVHDDISGGRRILRRGGTAVETPARLPPGHPEGYYEAFGGLYADAAEAIRSGAAATPTLPTAADGLAGMHFIEKSIVSASRSGAWLDL
jgi:predicted dehydrogenase